MRANIVARAARAGSVREAADVVLAAVVEARAANRSISLEEVKSLLVDALRAWRQRNGPRRTLGPGSEVRERIACRAARGPALQPGGCGRDMLVYRLHARR